MFKKILVSMGTLALATLLVGSTNVFGEATKKASAERPTIALVNEDEPASFNGASYLFGKDFVGLVSNDDQYNWQVVSRSVAENAYADQGISAMIVLPRSFSHDILTFQDVNPARANIDYKVAGGDELSHQRLRNQVSTILRDFNTRVVKMYFASIAGNVSGAQVNMGEAVATQSALLDALSNTVSPNLATTARDYGTVVGLAGILRALNSGWISAQNSFSTSAASTLTSTSDSLSRQQPSLSDYFALQQQIAHTNVMNGNLAISSQARSDKDYYDEAFSAHIDTLRGGDGTWSGFTGFSSSAPDGTSTGVLATVKTAVAGYDNLAVDFNSRIQAVNGRLTRQRGALATSLQDLEDLETRLLSEYFVVSMPADNAAIGVPAGDQRINDANYKVDLSTLTDNMARLALAQKVATSFNAGSSAAPAVAQYDQQIRDLVAAIPTDPAQYTELF